MMSNFVKISTHFLILLSIISQLEAYNVQKCSACEAVAVRIILLNTTTMTYSAKNSIFRDLINP